MPDLFTLYCHWKHMMVTGIFDEVPSNFSDEKFAYLFRKMTLASVVPPHPTRHPARQSLPLSDMNNVIIHWPIILQRHFPGHGYSLVCWCVLYIVWCTLHCRGKKIKRVKKNVNCIDMWCTPQKRETSDILGKMSFWYHCNCKEHAFSF